MARYLIGWEFGAGLGHVSPIAELARRLVQRGHEVHAVTPDAYASVRAFGDFSIPIYTLPNIKKARKPFRPTLSMAEVLYNLGYHSSSALAVKLAAWRSLCNVVRPDVVVTNYAPTANLAARDLPVPVLQFGTGFAVPPAEVPVPGFSLLRKVSQDRLLASEQGAVGKINRALRRIGAPEIKELKDAFAGDRDILVTFRELDHYPERVDGEYLGPLISATFNQPPVWPPGNGDEPRIFCYLKAKHGGFESMVRALGALDARVLIYAAGLGASRRRDLATDRLRFADRPVDLQLACRESDVVVCHAGHGSVATALLAGTELLLMPEKEHAEQWMNAKNVVRLGLGEAVAPAGTREDIEVAVSRVMGKRDHSRTADFRNRYRDFDREAAWEVLAKAAESVA